MDATLSHPVPSDPEPIDPQENTAMPPSPTAPRLPPALAAKVGQVIGASTPIAPASATPALTRAPNTTPAAASVATQARTTAAPSPATPRLPPGVRLPSNVPVTKVADVPVSSPPTPAARATGVVPPDAPNPRAAAPAPQAPVREWVFDTESETFVVFTPGSGVRDPDVYVGKDADKAQAEKDLEAMKKGHTMTSRFIGNIVQKLASRGDQMAQAIVEPAPVTDQQKEQALLALGWPEDVLSLMPADVFEEAYEARLPFADVEIVYGQDADGQYVESFARKPPPAPAAPARRRREAAAEPVKDVEVAHIVSTHQQVVTKMEPRKGVPFGAPAPGDARRPRNAAERLATYGYSDAVIGKMSTDTMQYILKNEVPPTVVSILPDGSGVRFDIEPEASSTETAGSASSTETAAAEQHLDAGAPDEAAAAEIDEQADAVMGADYEDPTIAQPLKPAPDSLFEAAAETSAPDPVFTADPTVGLPTSTKASREEAKTKASETPKLLQPYPKETIDLGLGEKASLALYIDCVPTKGEAYTDFAEFIAPHVDAVAQAHGAENFYDLDKLFGRGPGMVAARLLLPANRPTGALVIDSRHPFAAACVADLQRFATRVVRAMR
jgi:hypothetical protein